MKKSGYSGQGIFSDYIFFILTSLMAHMVKHLPTMWETWVQSLGWEDHLEKEMATHSSTLAWKIPRTEEPGGLQSMGLQRVRHDWVTSLSFLSFPFTDNKPILLMKLKNKQEITSIALKNLPKKEEAEEVWEEPGPCDSDMGVRQAWNMMVINEVEISSTVSWQ